MPINRFIKVNYVEAGHHYPFVGNLQDTRITWLNIDHIIEFKESVPGSRFFVPIHKDRYDSELAAGSQNVFHAVNDRHGLPDGYYEYLATTEVIIVEGDHFEQYYLPEYIEQFRFRMEQVVGAVPTINQIVLPVTGPWTELQVYKKDEVVYDPDDHAIRFLSLRENQSSTKPTTSSHTGWCLLPSGG